MRLSQIDETNISDHYFLRAGDQCFFLYEYTSRQGLNGGSTNSLILNLKKKPSSFRQQGYHYKAKAIRQCSRDLAQALRPDWLDEATLVPVPGSKANDHPDYDDRIEQICRGIRDGLDVRNLVIQTKTMLASHEVGDGERPTVEELLEAYQIDETLAQPTPTDIGIVDDVLTTGRHFRAMHAILSERFPEARIIGIFIARRVFPSPDEVFSG